MEVIKYMNKKGYFQREQDYKKCLMWASEGIIVHFMKEDYKKYKENMEKERVK